MAESNIVRELLVRLGVITDDPAAVKAFDAQIDAAKKSMQRAAEYAGKAKEQVALLVGQFVAVGAAAATAVGGLVYLSDETATYALNVERQAAALGMTADVYQELRGTFERFGVDQRDVADLFAQISQQSTAAQGGAKNVVAAFNTLGIATKDLKGKDPEGILLAIADGAARTKDPVARLSALSSLLGEDLTKKLAPLLQQGSKGIAQFRQEIRDLGGVMDADGIAKAAEYKDAVGDLKILITGIAHEIGVVFLPVLTRAAEKLRTFIEDTRKSPKRLRAMAAGLMLAATAAGALFTALAAFRVGALIYNAIMATTYAISALGTALSSAAFAGTALETVGLSIAALGAGPLAIMLGALVAWLAMLAAAFAGIAAGVGVAYLVMEDLMMFLSSSGDTVLGRFVDRLQASDSALGAMARTFASMRAIVGSWLSILGSLATMLGVTLQPTIKTITTALGSLYAALGLLANEAIAAGLEKAFAPFYLFEKVLASIEPMIQRIALGLAGIAADGTGIGGLVANTAAAYLPAGLGGVAGADLASTGAAAGGTRNNSYVDQSTTSFEITAPNAAAAAGAVAPVVAEQRAKTARATRATLGGGER